MNILDQLTDPLQWDRFYDYKCRNTPERLLKPLRSFIDDRAYLPVVARMQAGIPFDPPRKKLISKRSTAKKRTVYVYPPAENMVLKLLSYLLVRKYDGLFCSNLHSFRVCHSAQDAITRVTGTPGIDSMYTYKVDISNYFNSVDIDLLEPMLRAALPDQPDLCAWLLALLKDGRALDGKNVIREHRGIMAGTPISVFLANLYLSDLDYYFRDRGVVYARYSDDILVTARTEEELLAHRAVILRWLEDRRLSVNPKKEAITAPGEKWLFLGVSYCRGTVDISPVSLSKIKAKIRRKTRALSRWAARKGVPGEMAAMALIRVFNRKLLENDQEHELTWVRWFFPLINTTQSLLEIDHYLQDNIRFLASGKRTKGRYRFRYEDMKALGYVSLVHRYYMDSEGASESSI